MRRNDFNHELAAMVDLLELRPGDLALDMQTEPDKLLPILHHEVTAGGRVAGRVVGMNFGQQTLDKVREQLEGYRGVQLLAAHPTRTAFKPEIFHAVILRHDLGIPRLETALTEMRRISKPGARIIARHLQWNVTLPQASDHQLEMLESLVPASCANGKEFFERFSYFGHASWRSTRFDVYSVAHSDEDVRTRHQYDWRTMMKEQLTRTRRWSAREMIDLVEGLENNPKATVVADRYLAWGVKS